MSAPVLGTPLPILGNRASILPVTEYCGGAGELAK
jgi:hypothetical protein